MANLLEEAPYKPFNYPWAYNAWLTQQKLHWMTEEIPLHEDVKDWKTKLSESEKDFLTQIFRFFTQADIDVNNCYMKHYMPVFKPTEILMMMSAFSNIETIHVDFYSKLIDTVGMPEVEYLAFMEYKEMKDKHEYMNSFSMDTKLDIALTLAGFGAFTEGLQLYASFAMLLNFQRFGKMKGMCQGVAYSARDESLHCESIIKLFHTFLYENPEINNKKLEKRIIQMAEDVINLEDKFIRLAFNGYQMEGLTEIEVKNYIRYIADMRIRQLGYTPIYHIKKNPLPWLDEILNGVEFTNFFENRVTEYSKGATQGNWEEAFNDD